eukprot:TRINITY_DN108429_c0_g1_i1.p1 TRINITY_DN108429_c0_g1~~TRINITY_DN108429_c0_g1_i1.p1  ORF type:complete len:185 (+),score=26.26 TRINITY_DN108429_c0_g1_i1:64-618(+)
MTIESQDNAQVVDKCTCQEVADQAALPQPLKRPRHGGSCDLLTALQAVPDLAGNLAVYLWEGAHALYNHRRKVHADVRSLLNIGKGAQLQLIVGIKDARASQDTDTAIINIHLISEQVRLALPETWKESRRLRLASTTDTDRKFVTHWLRLLTAPMPPLVAKDGDRFKAHLPLAAFAASPSARS